MAKRLYRTYRYGVRITVEASSRSEALARFDGIARDYPSARNPKRAKANPAWRKGLVLTARTCDQFEAIGA